MSASRLPRMARPFRRARPESRREANDTIPIAGKDSQNANNGPDGLQGSPGGAAEATAAVVRMDRVTGEMPLPAGMDAGLNVQVLKLGRPEQV